MDLFGILSKIVIETTPLQDGFNRGTYKGVLSCTIFTQKDIYYRLVLTRLQHNADYVAGFNRKRGLHLWQSISVKCAAANLK